jgi:hypothetical protein
MKTSLIFFSILTIQSIKPMTLSERINAQVNKLPAPLRALLDAELAAGNTIKDVEPGRGPDQGKAALVLAKPFHVAPNSAPAGVIWRERDNKDMHVFEFVLPDDSFSLMTVKWKPMELPKLSGPTNPNEAHRAFAEQHAKREEAARAAHAAREAAEAATAAAATREKLFGNQSEGARIPKDSSPKTRFLQSMEMNYEKWHDGTGYDLEILRKMSPQELGEIETILINHQPRDWRDIEALAEIDSPGARKAIEAALKDSDPQVRREAANHAGDKVNPADREAFLLKALKTCSAFDGLTEALDEAEEFHPPSVIDALVRGALNRDGETAVQFAAMLFFLHGKAKEQFDWDHRPFFLRFNTDDRKERKAVFRELCQTIGVDPEKYLR